MKQRAAAVVAAGIVAGLLTVVPATPASAAVTTTVVGANINVTATGDVTVTYGCTGGTVRISGATTSPAVACTAFTGGTVTGDGGNQTIQGDTLAKATFPALLGLNISANGGNDAIYGSPAPDAISAGDGTDAVVLDISGKADTSIDLGTDAQDTLYLEGTSADDTITVNSGSSASGHVDTKAGAAATVSRNFSGVTALVLDGKQGDDTLSTKTDFTAAPVTMLGGTGDDTLETGSGTCDLFGGEGTNTYKGGQCLDYVHSVSDTDIINGGASSNTFYDETSLRSGGRTITQGSGASDTYEVDLTRADAVWRTRRGTPQGESDLVASLNRPGKQHLPSTVDEVIARFTANGEPADHTLADVEGLYAMTVTIKDGTKTTVVDITIPTGSWSTSGTIGNGTGTVTPAAFGVDPIVLQNVGPVSVHGPWTNKNRSFVHRATRDLLFSFATTLTLDAGQAYLTNGTLTRPQLTASLMDNDEYLGLDVDRTFVKYLRRKADAGGRSYWISSISNGKALWRFRAQLFGSNEYFTKAGGTNATYVEKAYADVLGRSPDPSGKAYWTNKLNGGADRGSVALQFINSPEARRRLVDDQFLRFLDRKPTAGEQTTWVDALPGATGEQDLIAFLVNSGAYFDRT